MPSPTKISLDTIHLGDCLQWLKTLPDESIDCIVSSPPYNIGKEYEVRRALSIYLEEQTAVLAECVRVLKCSGSLFWQIGSYSANGSLIPLDVRFFPILEDLGLVPRNRMVWIRQHGLHARNKFSARYETILWFTKSDEYIFNLDAIRVPQKYQNKKSWRGDNKGELTCNPLGKNPGDVWIFQNVKHNHEEQTIHPAAFPEDMIARIVLATTDTGAVVLDPYMGTGTVAVTSRDLDRHYVGAEIDPSYHSVALRRIAGTPDAAGVFPNLKTLRDYCEARGEDPAKYKFDAQTAKVASGRAKSRRFSELHHLQELEDRLRLEESAFGDRLRDISDGLPDIERYRTKEGDVPSLFDVEAV
ncbi:site-specific DNA-methyltransferase [Pseudarthrobacter sp. MDT3-28]|uniref:DNA-methyltransferase n=1 Tax=Pseudarthrobacter raffinosi TaxID=2953651 RepID=UPI00208F9BE2|nr:site-specific DNA-methyltransferase [Pseudarthrobacter sp. MDT3-28]MCO4239740.1 site-specific DNA-methyltransferase [Pseudarthrobacter sp. MDT3-28]